jgi:hypothetical protein
MVSVVEGNLEKETHLAPEHRPRRDLHVVTQFEVRREVQR